MNILSIQSAVTYGHVGNSAATFPLQRLGAEVWPINTVQFSNHPGYGDWTGRVGSGEEIAALIDGIARRGALERCDAVLSGYLGDPSVAEAAVETVRRVRAANPAALYCCDPVIGDAGRVYVRDGIPGLLATAALPEADLLTPNQFELERLSGIEPTDRATTGRAMAALRARMRSAGPRAVLLTSAILTDTPADALDVVAADDAGLSSIRVPRLRVAASGAGDLTAALFLFHFLQSGRAAAAMTAAVSAVHAVVAATAAAGARDLLLVEQQAALVKPPVRFEAMPFPAGDSLANNFAPARNLQNAMRLP